MDLHIFLYFLSWFMTVSFSHACLSPRHDLRRSSVCWWPPICPSKAIQWFSSLFNLDNVTFNYQCEHTSSSIPTEPGLVPSLVPAEPFDNICTVSCCVRWPALTLCCASSCELVLTRCCAVFQWYLILGGAIFLMVTNSAQPPAGGAREQSWFPLKYSFSLVAYSVPPPLLSSYRFNF